MTTSRPNDEIQFIEIKIENNFMHFIHLCKPADSICPG